MTTRDARLAAEQGVHVTPARAEQLARIADRLNDATRAAADRQSMLADPAIFAHTLASLRDKDET